MTIRTITALFSLAVAVLVVLVCGGDRGVAADHTGLRPNILVVLADDLGYGDLGCYGSETVRTPHLDKFARQGLRLTSCYAASANCSPARTGLMTGRTPYRVGIYNWIPMGSPMHVRAEEVTIAELLGESGYETCHVGKWHLNGKFNSPEQPQPSDQGFGHWFSTQNNALPNHHDPFNFVRNGQPVGEQEGYAADLVAAEAVRWLTDVRDASKPFFLFVCFHEPHEPIATAPRFCKEYEQFGDAARAAHHGNITQMDAAFGRLMAVLDERKLGEETLVFFTSDNGPAITPMHPYGSAGPLRAKKGHLYEGGIRVPGLLRWPGHTRAGTVSEEPVSGVDLLPTLCAVTGTDVPTDRTIDGADFLSVLDGQRVERKTPLYWQFNYAQSQPKVALRDGDWKILAGLTGPSLSGTADITDEAMRSIQRAELTDFALYNLAEDIGETTDLAAKDPKRLAAMRTQLEKLYREIQQENPMWPAWESPRYESQRIIWETDARR